MRVYRNEATDASHDFMFTQTEWLLVDKNISLANLIATTRTFLQKLFGREDLNVKWEKTDKADALREASGL